MDVEASCTDEFMGDRNVIVPRADEEGGNGNKTGIQKIKALNLLKKQLLSTAGNFPTVHVLLETKD